MHPSDELVRYGVEVSKRVRRVSLKRYTPLSAPPAYAQVHGRFDDPLDMLPISMRFCTALPHLRRLS